MSAHTPGPWRAEGVSVKCGRKNVCGTVNAAASEDLGLAEAFERSLANARLIAAAPETAAERDRLKAINAELLEALKALAYFTARRRRLESERVSWMDEKISAAIKKATEA